LAIAARAQQGEKPRIEFFGRTIAQEAAWALGL
jgi:hypothetical protein